MGDATVIGIAPALFFETTNRRDQRRVGGVEPEHRDPQEHSSMGHFNLQAWFLTQALFHHFRIGGGLAWYNNYKLREALQDGEKDSADKHHAYGHMFQLWFQPEYVIPEVVSKLNVIIGLRGGANVLFASGEFGDQLDALERQGFNVWGMPRLGIFGGPQLGVSWPLAERVLVRGDVGLQFGKIWLYDVKAEAEGIVAERSAQLTTTRTSIGLGVEIVL
jgi:hypothetical protein